MPRMNTYFPLKEDFINRYNTPGCAVVLILTLIPPYIGQHRHYCSKRQNLWCQHNSFNVIAWLTYYFPLLSLHIINFPMTNLMLPLNLNQPAVMIVRPLFLWVWRSPDTRPPPCLRQSCSFRGKLLEGALNTHVALSRVWEGHIISTKGACSDILTPAIKVKRFGGELVSHVGTRDKFRAVPVL